MSRVVPWWTLFNAKGLLLLFFLCFVITHFLVFSFFSHYLYSCDPGSFLSLSVEFASS